MIINMAVNATEEQIDHGVKRIQEGGFQADLSLGEERAVIGVVGKSEKHRGELEALQAAPGVEEIIRITHPFKLASRNFRPEGSVVELGRGVSVGGTEIVAAAGPCPGRCPARNSEVG